ncbi:tagatose-bisphosphate aldolase [Paenibacillus helianthi]|uniref:Tagatose-bisphosphate aldolase n=1 Tax=Paenibacillus helianthi TaxID=1349432 RepID=A0ABX3EJP4_9BACL|nr:class II fructose-bisphosphate aldolase [Paenibacillus helianthi]OKP80720.1 tagatose-bisphosphate aldolase [Paenibacillus helianthi]
MPLISSTEMLQIAKTNHYAVCAFNIHSFEMLQAVAEAAAETSSPIIIQTSINTVKYLGLNYLVAAAAAASENTGIPITLHLDHCTDFDMIVRCIRAGYTSVMIDASMHPFEENVRQTRKIVEIASAGGVNVEAELGNVGNASEDSLPGVEGLELADPEACKLFVESTRVATLAPAIGTVHGITRQHPEIDFARIGQIAENVDAPLVLHGGSSIHAAHLRKAVELGIAKVNVATELRVAFSEAIRQVFSSRPEENDPRRYMNAAKEAVKRLAIEKMEICGCIGKAGDI